MLPLVCIDVDGTLVGSSGTVLPAVWAAADRARASGVRLVLCSGRPAFGVTRDFAARLDPDGWHVFQNGASIVQLRTGESRSARIPPESVIFLVQRARRLGRVLELYTDTSYAVESTGERAREHARLLGIPFEPRPFASLHAPIVRAQWLVATSEEEAVCAEPHPGLELSASTSPVMPDTAFVNITPAGVNKASAVARIAEVHGVALSDVMFVGDGHNDVGAMKTVGHPVAMANAEPEVKAVATRTVGHVDDAGLAEALGLAIDGKA